MTIRNYNFKFKDSIHRQIVLGTLALLFVMLSYSCAKDSGKIKDLSSSKKSQSSQQTPKKQQQQQQQDDTGNVVVTNSFATLTYSLGQNNLTSYTIKTKVAKGYAEELSSHLKDPTHKDALKLQAIITAKTLGSAGFNETLEATKRYLLVEMKNNSKAILPDQVRLQLAIAAMESGKYTMAQYQLSDLADSKNNLIKAAYYNLNGLLLLKEENFADAAIAWKRAIKAIPGYQPASLNLGFLAIKYGDFRTAKAHLGLLQNDWFGLFGLAAAERAMGNSSRVKTLCSQILAQKPDYKPALLTCALNEYQGLGNIAEAKTLLKRLVKSQFGPRTIDEIAYRILGRIENAQSNAVAHKSSHGKIKKAKASKK